MKRIRLEGHVADKLERFAKERITSAAACEVVYREAEDAFRNRLDDSSGVHGIWQGEFWGKWVISAVRYCEYSGDAGLKEFLRQGVRNLLDLQEPSGYLGTYRDPMNVFAADPEKTLPVLGWRCNWNWNIWCRKYTLWGLLEAYRLLEEPEILDGAARLAEHLIDSLRENGIRLGSTGTFAGIPSGSILKPMVLLHRATGREKFLDFAREIVADWKREDGLRPNLIVNALSGKPVYQWYPEPKSWAKAYEMISCFDGIIELYRVTGEPELLESAVRFHRLLKEHDGNLLFSVGFNDIFNHAGSQISAITEPCDVIHWMRLCGELFRETGEAGYLDDFELAFYNSFLASVCRDGKWGARGARSHGRHMYVTEQAKMKHNHCCVNNVPRGFMNFAELAATVGKDVVSINFYSSFDLETDALKLSVRSDYPAPGSIRIEWEAKTPGVLRFRIPGWAAEAECAGAKRNGDCFELSFMPGKSFAVLNFTWQVVIREHAAPTEAPPWYRERWREPGLEEFFRTGRGSTLLYGPMLLARSRFAGNAAEEMADLPLAPGFECTLRRIEPEGTDFAFEAEFRSGGEVRRTTVCDYASAGDAMTEEAELFSVFF